ncbi:hypothetical protein CalGV035 [Clostera anastomosis granulovirus A]|uniref:Uncharacterized protein n=1 Tax=Clostera anastomosis granulovirus A TaxID=1986289 RepID=U5KBU0_9BBAC|nr:hypothetical protein CalGV035 [Clostera anastomosis granulovirus Henan]AGQ20294.1 hypothetical protein CalGV035 [Clostera anastomosis granulovirus Henan]
MTAQPDMIAQHDMTAQPLTTMVSFFLALLTNATCPCKPFGDLKPFFLQNQDLVDLYGYDIPLYTVKQLSDAITSHISDRCIINARVYSTVVANARRQPTVQGGLIINHILGRDVLGDLDLSFELSSHEFGEMLYMDQDHLSQYVKDKVVHLENHDFKSIISNSAFVDAVNSFNFVENFANVNTLDARVNGVKVFNTNGISNYHVTNTDSIKLEIVDIDNYTTVLNNEFVLNRYYVDIKLVGQDIFEKRGIYQLIVSHIPIRYYFLDISMSVAQNYGQGPRYQIASLFGGVRCLHIKHIITDQIHAIIVGMFHNNSVKINKRLNRVLNLLKIMYQDTSITCAITEDELIYFIKKKQSNKKILFQNIKRQLYRMGHILALKYVLHLLKNDLIVRNIKSFSFNLLGDVHVTDLPGHFQRVHKDVSKIQQVICNFYKNNVRVPVCIFNNQTYIYNAH